MQMQRDLAFFFGFLSFFSKTDRRSTGLATSLEEIARKGKPKGPHKTTG
jgi:hypothetical protein